MKLYAFHGGGEIGDMAIFDPFAPDVGTKINIPYFFYLIRHPQGNVLFDTGGHPDLIDNPRARLGAAADAFELIMRRGTMRSVSSRPWDSPLMTSTMLSSLTCTMIMQDASNSS